MHHFADVWKQIANLCAAVPVRMKPSERRLQKSVLLWLRRHTSLKLFSDRNIMIANETRLGVERVDMRKAARHVEHDDVLRFRSVVWFALFRVRIT